MGSVSPNMEWLADIAGNAVAAKFQTLYYMFKCGFLCRGDMNDDVFMMLRVHTGGGGGGG